MAHVLEEINKELLAELYDLKKQLKTVVFENHEKDKISECKKYKHDHDKEYEDIEELEAKLSKAAIKLDENEENLAKIEAKLAETEAKLAEAEENNKELKNQNVNLNTACFQMHRDNAYLTQQVSALSAQNLQQAVMLQSAQMQKHRNIQTLQQVESLMKIQSEDEEDEELARIDKNSLSDEEENHGYDGSDEKESEGNSEEKLETSDNSEEKAKQSISKRKVSTIAMKLKLAKDQPNHFIPEPSPTFFAPRFKQEAKEKVRSIMVGGLFRGLTQKNIVDHFERFGPVIEYREPVKSYNQPDGTKFVFLKFMDYNTVDKAVVFAKHTINNINVIVKKSYKDL